MASAKRPAWWWATAWANLACAAAAASSAPRAGPIRTKAAARAKESVRVTVVEDGRERSPEADYSAVPYWSRRFPPPTWAIHRNAAMPLEPRPTPTHFRCIGGIGWGVDERKTKPGAARRQRPRTSHD